MTPQSLPPALAVFGLGRSGLSIARAARRRGSEVTVYDESSPDALAKPELLAEAEGDGIRVVTGWTGDLSAVRAPWLITNPAVRRDHPVLLGAVHRGVEVLSEVEFAWRISLAPILAITGTNGKSTATVMTMLALRATGVNAILCGNIFGSGYPEIPLTEAADTATETDFLVAEVSSFQLEWVSQFRPVAAGITVIGSDHLDRYGGKQEDYAATKRRIYAAQAFPDVTVLPASDTIPEYQGRRRRTSVPPENAPLTLQFGSLATHSGIDDQFLTILDQRIPLDSLPFREPHNLRNAAFAGLMAYGALWSMAKRGSTAADEIMASAREEWRERHPGRTYGGKPVEPDHILPRDIVTGLQSFRGLRHRMEWLGERHGVRVVNNSMCTNPEAVIASVQAARDPVHILMGGVNKDLSFAPVRHYLANGRHHAYLFGRDAAAINEELGGSVPVYASMEDAFRTAIEAARPGEIVMLAPGCASSDQFRDFRHRGDVFRELALEWING